jgi:hypothetical protein
MATTYYVDNTGGTTSSDTYDGSSPTWAGGISTVGPWATIGHVNAQTFNGGNTILLKGGQTFTAGFNFTTANFGSSPVPSASAPVAFGSYGTGQATISSGTAIGFSATNIASIALNNLIFTGSGGNTLSGIDFENSLVPDTALDYININNVTVSGYGRSGILIHGSAGNSGFSNITVTNSILHDNAGTYIGGSGSAGLLIYTGTGYLSGTPSFSNVVIGNVIAYNNTGAAGASNWTGSGIVVASANNVSVSFSHAYSNGANGTSTDAVGIFVYDSYGTVVCSFCESDHNGYLTDGFNIDQGTLEYCYAHDNAGIGALCDTYPNTNTATIRYCIFQNNNAAAVTNGAEVCISNYNASATLAAQVYNNTFYSAQPMIMIAGQMAGFSGNIANNIFYSAGGSFVNTGVSAVGSINDANLKFNGNDYFTTGTFSLTWNATTYTSFTTWQSAHAQEARPLSNPVVNPSLVNPGGGGTTNGYSPGLLGAYKLQTASPMLGAGINLLTTFSINPGGQDYFGHSIPSSGGPVNVGAGDQFGRSGQMPMIGMGNMLAGAFGMRSLVSLLRNPVTARRQLLGALFGERE